MTFSKKIIKSKCDAHTFSSSLLRLEPSALAHFFSLRNSFKPSARAQIFFLHFDNPNTKRDASAIFPFL